MAKAKEDKQIELAQVQPQEVKKKNKTKSARTLERKSPRDSAFANGGTWAVQLGTFAVPEHASTLLRKLKSQGLPAYARKTNRNGEALTVVFVGPIIRKEDASKMISTMESKYQLRGIIVRYGVGR